MVFEMLLFVPRRLNQTVLWRSKPPTSKPHGKTQGALARPLAPHYTAPFRRPWSFCQLTSDGAISAP